MDIGHVAKVIGHLNDAMDSGRIELGGMGEEIRWVKFISPIPGVEI